MYFKSVGFPKGGVASFLKSSLGLCCNSLFSVLSKNGRNTVSFKILI